MYSKSKSKPASKLKKDKKVGTSKKKEKSALAEVLKKVRTKGK